MFTNQLVNVCGPPRYGQLSFSFSKCGRKVAFIDHRYRPGLLDFDKKTILTFEEAGSFADISISPCGKYLALLSCGTTIVKNIETGERLLMKSSLYTYYEHSWCTYSPCGKYVMSYTSRMLAIHDAKTGEVINKFGDVRGVSQFKQCEFHPNGQQIVIMSHRICTLQDIDGKNVKILMNRDTDIFDRIAISPCGSFLVLASHSKHRFGSSIEIYDFGSEKIVKEILTNKMLYRDISISCKQSISAITAGGIAMFDIETEKHVATFSTGSYPISLKFSPCGCYIITGSTNGDVFMFNVTEWDAIAKTQKFHIAGVQQDHFRKLSISRKDNLEEQLKGERSESGSESGSGSDDVSTHRSFYTNNPTKSS